MRRIENSYRPSSLIGQCLAHRGLIPPVSKPTSFEPPLRLRQARHGYALFGDMGAKNLALTTAMVSSTEFV